MAGVVSGSLYRRTHSLSRLALWLGLGSAAAWRRSTFINEPGELSEWLCHDDSTINIFLELPVLLLSIIICSCLHSVVMFVISDT